MPDLPTRTDLFNVFAEEVLARGRTRPGGKMISASEIFTPGSDVNLIMAGGSAMGEEVVRQLGRSTADLTLSGAQGAALDRYIADRYNNRLPRKTAAAARVPVQLVRPTAGFGAFTYPAGSRVSTPGGVEFITQADAVFAPGSLGPVAVAAKASSAGTAGNVGVGTITRLVTATADATVGVSNAEAATGGDEDETDDAYRGRAEKYYPSLVRGTTDALVVGALMVPGIRSATAVEDRDVSDQLTGLTYLYVADVNGTANASLVAEVSAELLDWRASGGPVVVVGGTPVLQSIVFHLAFETGVDQQLAFDALRRTVVARVNQLAPQEPLLRSMLIDIANSISGIIVRSDAITLPVGDVYPPVGSGQVIRTSTSLVSNV